jgi:hypothetical protein
LRIGDWTCRVSGHSLLQRVRVFGNENPRCIVPRGHWGSWIAE